MKTPTQPLAAALRQLANDIDSPDGVANAAIAEAAERLGELMAQVETIKSLMLDLVEHVPQSAYPELYDKCAKLANDSPTQCLREIQASAIDAAVDFEDGRYCETVSDRIDMILDYANLIRKGGE